MKKKNIFIRSLFEIDSNSIQSAIFPKVIKETKFFIKIKLLRIQMDHVKPMLAQIICDSTREKGIIARFAMAISGIFIKKVTKLLTLY